MSETMESIPALRENGINLEKSGRITRNHDSKSENDREMFRADSTPCTTVSSGLQSDIEGRPQFLHEDISQYEQEEREMFSNLEKPRVRYDVEVITKLIVYTGKKF